MEKKYVAVYDNGHDYGEFEFYSRHRANSKPNIEDAQKESRSRYGHEQNITSTMLMGD